jgi:hypothetical protein
MFVLDNVGIPLNYRHMPGFGVHTFELINKAGRAVYVKFHWPRKCGTLLRARIVQLSLCLVFSFCFCCIDSSIQLNVLEI